ncbi:hypothetical protein LLEC1_02698 [Akanthomyces lecanii]|uniref:DNA replication complex GINS protein PSF1 n=1 Tax=Cordyceps confragosa TaxID=2714763 RepID=A0A179IDT3_CORDF|nr:hypothetical protein LLEC1_02698 [Akanthomyces lecanii]
MYGDLGVKLRDANIQAQHAKRTQNLAHLPPYQAEIVRAVTREEEDYVRQYSDLLAAYKGQWTDIDLTGSLQPPRDLFIDVRVLKDAGEIQTEYGASSAINLTKNSQFYVRQGDVERLIAQGYLQKLD